MLKGAVGSRYAQALFDIASGQDKVDQWQAELEGVVQTLETVRELSRALYHPRVTTAEKRDLLKGVFASALSGTTLNFICLLVDRHRELFLPDIVATYVALADSRRGLVEANVDSALELTAAEKDRLNTIMEKITCRKVRARYRVEPSLVGGVVVRMGDRVLDGSLRTRLARLADRLKATS
ncbi:MAG: ATP synthase F1 subunit delta [Peptococcaceae bacterium]|jgi:F-type H+-transporting ATPase subunit delta|nr:ATP synthase F1 subunit delta [Peptococcaceae bacterium]